MNDYQAHAKSTAIYPKEIGLFYAALGLTGEAGEVADVIKKLYRDDNGSLTPERKQTLMKEIGDVLWYTATLATELGLDLETIAQANVGKLASRKQRNALNGDGNDR